MVGQNVYFALQITQLVGQVVYAPTCPLGPTFPRTCTQYATML